MAPAERAVGSNKQRQESGPGDDFVMAPAAWAAIVAAVAVGETVILLQPPLPLVGFSIRTEIKMTVSPTARRLGAGRRSGLSISLRSDVHKRPADTKAIGAGWEWLRAVGTVALVVLCVGLLIVATARDLGGTLPSWVK